MTSSVRKLIGLRIQTHRKKKLITQASLAEALGCEVTTLSRYERGEYAPDSEQLIRIANFLGLSPMDLLPGEIDLDRQRRIDLRARLVDLVYSIDDEGMLNRLIKTIESQNR